MAKSLLCLELECNKPQRAFKDDELLDDPRVLQNLLDTEERYMPPTSNFLFQKDLRPYMRKVVAEWMFEVCVDLKNPDFCCLCRFSVVIGLLCKTYECWCL